MSIWCSQEAIGFDDAWRRAQKPHGGQVRSYASGWSNHYPTTDGKVERRACIDLATIAPWCVPGHDDIEGFEGMACGPWLRLCLNSSDHDYHNPRSILGPENASVVMDEAAVREMVAQLTEWLNRPKVHPPQEPTQEESNG